MNSAATTTRSAADPDRHFRTEHLHADLKGRSIRGGALTVVGQALCFGIQVGSTMVLARLLAPEAFGLVAMVGVVVGFIHMFRDPGLSMATLQRAGINHAQVSTLFWVNVALGGGFALLLVAAAPLIAWFFGEPLLLGIAAALSVTLLFHGLLTQHEALLRRQMRFRVLTVIAVVARLVAAIVGIAAALLGAGFWALVLVMVTQPGVYLVLTWAASGWVPGAPRRGVGVGSMLRFGGSLTGTRFLQYIGFNLDNVLIGWAWGAGLLGLYEKAYRLLLLPITQLTGPLTSVAIPALSALQDEPERFRNYYRGAIELVAFLSTPMVVLLFVAADEAVLTVLGDQWRESIGVFRALGPAALVMATSTAIGWACIPCGRPERELRWTLMAGPVQWLSMAVGLQWGIYGVAVAVSISKCALRIPGLWYCYRVTPVRLADFFSAVWRPTVASVLAGAATFWVEARYLQPIEMPVLRLGVLAGCFALGCLVAWVVLPGGRARLAEIARSLAHLKPQGPGETGSAFEPDAGAGR